MRAMIVAGLVTGGFVAALFASRVSPVAAEGTGTERSTWQYQCFEASGVAQVTERANRMGQQGWELVTSAGSAKATLWCFKRPLWKR